MHAKNLLLWVPLCENISLFRLDRVETVTIIIGIIVYYVKRTVVAAVTLGDPKDTAGKEWGTQCSTDLQARVERGGVEGYCAQITLACWEMEMDDIV